MIVRRLARGMKERDWGLVFIELALVFAGVFVALQFDNWNAHQRNQAALTEMLERVSSELELNATVIQSMTERIDQGRPDRDRARQALSECDNSASARDAINLVLSDLTGEFSPSLSIETLPQLNRRDPYLDLLSSEFRTELAVYSNHIQEEQRQLQFNAGLRWDQHVMRHPFVAANLSEASPGLLIDRARSISEICGNASFSRQFFVTFIFLESTKLRLEHFSQRMDVFRDTLEAEIARRR